MCSASCLAAFGMAEITNANVFGAANFPWIRFQSASLSMEMKNYVIFRHYSHSILKIMTVEGINKLVWKLCRVTILKFSRKNTQRSTICVLLGLTCLGFEYLR